MMHDYDLDDIITDVQKDFIIWLPKKVIKLIVVSTLRRMFKTLRKNNYKVGITMYGGSIARIYNRIDFTKLEQHYMDVDETTTKVKNVISDKLLQVFHEKRSPRIRLRGKNSSTTLIFHERVGITR